MKRLAFLIVIAARLLPAQVFSYGNPPGTPTNCSHTDNFYATLDLHLCTWPSEVPLGTFSIPAVGSSYTDPNFGTSVTILSQVPSLVSYSTPSALSATGLYAAIAQNGATTIINATTGAVVRASAPGNITGTKVLNWDKVDNNLYYGIGSSNALNMYKVSDGSTTQLIANLATAIGCTSVQNGGTSDLSSDNWFPFFSDATCHKAGIVKLSNLHVYSFDYRTAHNGLTPGDMETAGGYVISSKGVDSVTGKRYIIAATNPFVFGYIVGDPNNGVINYERLGPERPHNAYVFTGGTDNNICETGERCLNDPHGDTMQDTDGQQYYMVQQDEKVSGVEYRTLTYFRINAGDLMMRSAATEGGGRTDIWNMYKTPDGWLEGHESCAKTAVCVISTHPPQRTAGDLTSAYSHQSHQGNIWAIKGVGTEIRALAYSQSINWGPINANLSSTNCNGTVCTFVTTTSTALLDGNDNTCISGTGLTAVDVSTSGRCWTSHKVNSTTFTINISTTGTSSTGTLGVALQYWPHPFASISGDGTRAVWNSNFGYYTIDGRENVATALTGFDISSGPGPVVTNGKANIDRGEPIIIINNGLSPYLVSGGDKYLRCDASGGSVVLNLPAATGSGRRIRFIKVDNTTNACTPTRAGSDLINGLNTIPLNTQWYVVELEDGLAARWDIVSFGPAILTGTSASIGGGALAAGACASTTVTVTGTATGMVPVVSPNTYPGDGAYWYGRATSTDTVTVKVCVAVAMTPTASTYNVRVIQ